jgi:NAD(P)-dependent dehydrogenase (short-subunit alcohol dehydrogenase family)
MDPASFKVFSNYVALPAIEAFRIEYWALEEAKIRRQPPEKELSRRVALVVGGASGIGREVAHLRPAAHTCLLPTAMRRARRALLMELASVTSPSSSPVQRSTFAAASRFARCFKAKRAGLWRVDILINTAALFRPHLTAFPDDMWADTLAVNVTANYLLADEAAKLFEEQGLHGNVVFTSSANAVVAKRGSEAYDVSKAALSHLIRELAVSMAPNVRVNGISPATVVKGSTMFGRDRSCARR